jgi:hypothetical protein
MRKKSYQILFFHNPYHEKLNKRKIESFLLLENKRKIESNGVVILMVGSITY